MVHYIALIDILNLTLYKPTKVGNVTFKPYTEITETLEKIRKDKMPRVTGYAECSFDLSSDNREEAFNQAEKIITPYAWLWSFAQNRTVCQWGISVSRVENGESSSLGTSWKPVMVESVYGVPLIRFPQWNKFLKTSIPVISSDDFVDKTNFILSLHLYLDANRVGLTETAFLKNWLAFEILVNAYCNVNGSEYIMSNSMFDRFRKRLKNLIEKDAEVGDNKKPFIITNLPGLRRYPLKKRIDDFFSAHNIDYDKNDIIDIKKIRDSITHTGKLPGDIEVGEVVDYERKLRVLLQRSYLTLLGCNFTYSVDDRGFMHPELT